MKINLYDVLIDYIENNKSKYNISYDDTLDYLDELLRTIKKDYEELEEE